MPMPLHRNFLCPVRGIEGEIQRDSTLNPIVGYKKRDKTLSDRILWVQKLWQRRVHDLEYFEPGLAKKAFFCNPSFCYTREKSFHCGLRNLCPFCYSRRVSGLFTHIEKACQDQQHQIVMRFGASAVYFRSEDELTFSIRNHIEIFKKQRPDFVERLAPAGSAIWLLFTALNDEVVFCSRQLFIFHEHQVLPDLLYANPLYKISNCMSYEKTVLARQLSKCFAYPPALLYGDAPAMKIVLENMENHHFFTTSGILRGRQL